MRSSRVVIDYVDHYWRARWRPYYTRYGATNISQEERDFREGQALPGPPGWGREISGRDEPSLALPGGEESDFREGFDLRYTR
jgi:hypothetical protein